MRQTCVQGTGCATRFALTANNVTYAATGRVLKYWDFFPAEDNWGCVPVWGYADVFASRCEGISVGERLFGFLPMASLTVIQPQKITDHSVVDGAPHRADLASIYNRYARVDNANTDRSLEDKHMIFYPLFVTAFLMQDFFAEHDYFGARTIIVSSASSKTAMGFAHLLARAKLPRPWLIGVTSNTNRKFVSDLNDYDDVIAYDELTAVSNSDPSVFVDIAGNAQVRKSIHHHLDTNLVYSCAVGTSHWDKFEKTGTLPGARPTFFFAPKQAAKGRENWGPETFQARIMESMTKWVSTMRWLEILHAHGAADIECVYRKVLDGQAQPGQGLICSFS